MQTITLPQLRDALSRLEANVSADELWCALRQQDLLIPAPGNWPEAAVDKTATLSHYLAQAKAAEALK